MDLCYGQPWAFDSWRRPRWIEITYVCRYWRSAALDLRELWSSITSDLTMTWSRVMIERSSPHPMHINIPINVPGMEMYTGHYVLPVSELLSTSRIRTLTLPSRPDPILHVLERHCNPSMLESLCLMFPDTGEPVDLPESFVVWQRCTVPAPSDVRFRCVYSRAALAPRQHHTLHEQHLRLIGSYS